MTEHIYDDSIECAFVNDTKRERIVRCRDCEYQSDDGLTALWCSENYREVRPDGFCAWAERREQ